MALFKKIIEEVGRPAILVGNGINLLTNIFPSWDELLKSISSSDLETDGLANTEIYDFIELKSEKGKELKKLVSNRFESVEIDSKAHQDFIELLILKECPVLTTNFDFSFEKSFNNFEGSFYRTAKNNFTRFYPWDTYFGTRQLEYPTDGFGIWHIHGMISYTDSIRLGLSDYMGSVEKASKIIRKEGKKLFNGDNLFNWDGQKTWLHIWFNMPLIIVGLTLSSSEVFIRWLLIEREKYFKIFPDRRQKTYYLSKNENTHLNSFLSNLNIKLERSADYASLYR